MYIEYDTTRLEDLLYDFYNVTGLSIAVVDSEYKSIITNNNFCQDFCRTIQEHNTEYCRLSDMSLFQRCTQNRQPAMHICHAGLVDASLPIIINNEIAGYIIMGQAKSTGNFKEISDRLPQELVPELEQHYEKLKDYSNNQMKSALNIASTLITIILQEQMIKAKIEHLAETATNYIASNLSDDLSVKLLCKNLYVSKNLLYKTFEKNFGCTVNEYITQKRIEKAAELLQYGNLPTKKIAEQTGFSDYPYFCKVFKKKMGFTPLEFRKRFK